LGTAPVGWFCCGRFGFGRFCLQSGLLLQQLGLSHRGARCDDAKQLDLGHVSFVFAGKRLRFRVLLLFTRALRLLLLRAWTGPDRGHDSRNAKRVCTHGNCGRAGRHLPFVFTRFDCDSGNSDGHEFLLLLSRHVLPLDVERRPQLGQPRTLGGSIRAPTSIPLRKASRSTALCSSDFNSRLELKPGQMRVAKLPTKAVFHA
jgi:hypothetical protein